MIPDPHHTPDRAPRGVRVLATGSALPDRRLTNADLEKVMDTSDEWIVQRTGVRERRVIGPGQSSTTLAADALRDALADSPIQPAQIDLLLVATMTPEMPTPSTACLVSSRLGLQRAGALDVNAACSGFVYGLNIAHDLIRGGSYRTIAVVGVDCLSTLLEYSTRGRGTAIIFGDAAGAVILQACDDPGKGILAQAMHADGAGWKDIFVPLRLEDFPPGIEPEDWKLGKVQMNGASVFKFAVSTFGDLIQQTLDKAGLGPMDVDHYICHQSNARILSAARERFGLPAERLYVNIERVGNTVAASVPVCLDELRKAGRVKPGQRVMFLAFGAGLTWSSSLWQL